jgi:hypothetical protein
MPSPLFLAYEAGETFSDISSIAITHGICWGTCTVPYARVDFSDSGEPSPSRIRFGNCHTDEERFDLYSRLDGTFRRSLLLPRRVVQRTVFGITLGFNAGGALDMFSSVEDMVRRIFREALSTTAGNSGLTTGSSGGLMPSGVFLPYPNSGNTMFSIEEYQMDAYDFCLIQGVIGAGVSSSASLLLMGNYGSLYNPFREHNVSSLDNQSLVTFLLGVLRNTQYYNMIGDVNVGLILPGGNINFLISKSH